MLSDRIAKEGEWLTNTKAVMVQASNASNCIAEEGEWLTDTKALMAQVPNALRLYC